MAYTIKFAQLQATTLAGSGAAIGATSIILTSFTTIDGTALAMTDFGSIAYGTIEPDAGTQEEMISFTGLTQNGNGTCTLTGVKHVLDISPHTQTSGTTKAHAGGVNFVISNTSAMYQTIIDYIDGIAIAGAPDMTLTAKGIGEEATQAEIDAGTQAGSTLAELVVNPKYLKDSIYYTRLPGADEKSALAGTSGTPSSTNKYVTNDDTATTGNSKVIRTGAGGKLVNSIIDFAGALPMSSGTTTRAAATASGTITIAHGLGVAPRLVKMTASAALNAANWFSVGTYNGTTNYCASTYTVSTDEVNSTSNTVAISLLDTIARGQSGVITVDATNIYIAWTRGDNADAFSAVILWEAYA